MRCSSESRSKREQRRVALRSGGTLLHALDVLVAELQRRDAQTPPRAILNAAATDRVDELAMRDREQPCKRRAVSLRSVAGKRGERRCEGLRGQVCRKLAVACAPQEEREHGVDAPAVEDPERLRVALACHEQLLIGTFIVGAHDHYIVHAGDL